VVKSLLGEGDLLPIEFPKPKVLYVPLRDDNGRLSVVYGYLYWVIFAEYFKV